MPYIWLLYILGSYIFWSFPSWKRFYGFFVLTYTGIECVLNAGKFSLDEQHTRDFHISSFFSGFFMSISNPLTILFWLGIYGSILANTTDKYDLQHILFYSSAIFLGLLSWDFSMALIASSFRRLLTKPLLMTISCISGFSLIGFGIYFAIQAAKIFFT